MSSPAKTSQQGFFKRLFHRIGQIQAMLLLSLLYLVLWFPVGLIVRMMKVDWLQRKAPPETCWWPRSERVNRPETLREAF